MLATSRELDAAAWRVAHVIGFVPAAASMVTAIWMDVRLTAVGHVAQMVGFLRTAQALGLFGCLVLATGIAGWPIAAGPTPYAVAVTTLFLSAVVGIVASFWVAMRQAMEPVEDAE